jgi:hypothetical protein
MEDVRYPIGKFAPQESYTGQEVAQFITRIESLPAKLESVVNGLTDQQLDTPYRDGGWTLRQVIHHISDSHLNSYIRFKWTLTEDTPLIKAYDEKAWATTAETKLPPDISLTLLRALHVKWTMLLKQLTSEDLAKKFLHPETQKHVPLDRLIHLYAWHGDHHLGHITGLKSRMGWQ